MIGDLNSDIMTSDLYVSPDDDKVYYMGDGERKYAHHLNYNLTCIDRFKRKNTVVKDVVKFDVSSDGSFIIYTKADDSQTAFYRKNLENGIRYPGRPVFSGRQIT